MSSRCDRLSIEDTQLLVYETSTNPMHIGSLMIVETGALAKEERGVDLATFRKGVASALPHAPRFRRHWKWLKVEEHPI